MLYVYRRSPSDSARELAEAMTVNCRRLNDLRKAHFGNGVRAGDAVICWGESLPEIEGVRILNGAPIVNKFDAAIRLKEAGVATVEVNRNRPEEVARVDVRSMVTQPHYNRQEMKALAEWMLRVLPPENDIYLPRKFNHFGGNDLLQPSPYADYWVKKENIVKEYRLHVFNGKSIRAGMKIPRDGATPHAWIRSLNGGWRICYDNFSSTKAQRELAAKALTALGLEFGAVDLAETHDGRLLVLEANRAPGTEGGTVEAYVNSIENWLVNHETAD